MRRLSRCLYCRCSTVGFDVPHPVSIAGGTPAASPTNTHTLALSATTMLLFGDTSFGQGWSVEPWLLPPLRASPCLTRLQQPPPARARSPAWPRTAGAARRPARGPTEAPRSPATARGAQDHPTAPSRPPPATTSPWPAAYAPPCLDAPTAPRNAVHTAGPQEAL